MRIIYLLITFCLSLKNKFHGKLLQTNNGHLFALETLLPKLPNMFQRLSVYVNECSFEIGYLEFLGAVLARCKIRLDHIHWPSDPFLLAEPLALQCQYPIVLQSVVRPIKVPPIDLNLEPVLRLVPLVVNHWLLFHLSQPDFVLAVEEFSDELLQLAAPSTNFSFATGFDT